MAPNALRVAKKATRETWMKDSKDNYYVNLSYIDEIFDHYNGIEGVNAFLEKRAPQFRYTDD